MKDKILIIRIQLESIEKGYNSHFMDVNIQYVLLIF